MKITHYNEINENTQIKKIAYSDDAKLFIQFQNDKTYVYKDVPENIYDGLIAASSMGSYLHREVKGNFRYEAIEAEIYFYEGLNLCEFCEFNLPECNSFPLFGNGFGNDNVYFCNGFKQRSTPSKGE